VREVGHLLWNWILEIHNRGSWVDAIAIVAALAGVGASKRMGLWAYAILSLPGTFAHELAHFIVAGLLFARPSALTVVPLKTDRGWRLGAVTFRAGPIRALPIALAPIALLPAAGLWAYRFLMGQPVDVWYVINVWIVSTLLAQCLPSVVDLRLAAPGLVALAGCLLFWWLI
jgi:hypothetical protein